MIHGFIWVSLGEFVKGSGTEGKAGYPEAEMSHNTEKEDLSFGDRGRDLGDKFDKVQG